MPPRGLSECPSSALRSTIEVDTRCPPAPRIPVSRPDPSASTTWTRRRGLVATRWSGACRANRIAALGGPGCRGAADVVGPGGPDLAMPSGVPVRVVGQDSAHDRRCLFSRETRQAWQAPPHTACPRSSRVVCCLTRVSHISLPRVGVSTRSGRPAGRQILTFMSIWTSSGHFT